MCKVEANKIDLNKTPFCPITVFSAGHNMPHILYKTTVGSPHTAKFFWRAY